MTDPTLLAAWQREEQTPFTGWDFSHLAGRMLEDDPPWSYSAEVAARMGGARAVLDLGTGGGECLLALRPHWPPYVAATEGYAPNLALATARLTPHGVTVRQAESDERTTLPFPDRRFDLVISRHSSFNAAELARVLGPGGIFYTQQVHGLYAADLLARFGALPPWPYATPDYFAAQLGGAGLAVTTRVEHTGRLRFTDVGAIVYYLKAVPWLVPGFAVATHLDALAGLQAQVDRGEALVFTSRHYGLEARKPH